MKRIQARQIRAAFLSLVLFSASLIAGFFKGIFFLPAAAFLAAYLWIDKKHLRCPYCAGFINLDRLLYAKTHEYHCACCGQRSRSNDRPFCVLGGRILQNGGCLLVMEIREYTVYREEEVLPLYAGVGWTAYTDAPEALREGFAHSLLTLAAYEENRLVGLVRAVGDGSTILYIQDLLVTPPCQRRGIGSRLLQAMLGRYPAVRQVLLASDNTPEAGAFYRAQGFCELAGLGCCGWMKV